MCQELGGYLLDQLKSVDGAGADAGVNYRSLDEEMKMWLKGEGGVKDNTHIVALGEWGCSYAINGECEVIEFTAVRLGANEEEFSFFTV